MAGGGGWGGVGGRGRGEESGNHKACELHPKGAGGQSPKLLGHGCRNQPVNSCAKRVEEWGNASSMFSAVGVARCCLRKCQSEEEARVRRKAGERRNTKRWCFGTCAAFRGLPFSPPASGTTGNSIDCNLRNSRSTNSGTSTVSAAVDTRKANESLVPFCPPPPFERSKSIAVRHGSTWSKATSGALAKAQQQTR